MSTVLVCDDDDDIRSLLVTLIGTVADRVTSAGDGLTALDLVAQDRPDLLLLDRGLPGGIEGLEVVRRVRLLDAPRPRILLLTARRQPEDVDAARQAGVDDFLGKPFRVPELMARVQELLALGPIGD